MAQHIALHQDAVDIVLGVDTHKHVHVAAVVTASGAFVASESFLTTAAGYEQLLAWARTLGRLSRAGHRPSAQSKPARQMPREKAGQRLAIPDRR
ncbi:hypothetical protein [Streptomyces sp. NPDC056190]|uniref:hypothetical protein n=1 Tax=Streptomyces sp. NPDC056190 TaxID=3345741 RepID=UPI0035E16AEC